MFGNLFGSNDCTGGHVFGEWTQRTLFKLDDELKPFYKYPSLEGDEMHGLLTVNGTLGRFRPISEHEVDGERPSASGVEQVQKLLRKHSRTCQVEDCNEQEIEWRKVGYVTAERLEGFSND